MTERTPTWWADALSDWLLTLQDEGKAAWTIHKYHYAGRAFLAWCAPRGFTAEVIRAYLRRHKSPATRRFHLSVMRAIVRHLRQRGEIPTDDVTASLRRPPLPGRPPRVLLPEEDRALAVAAAAGGIVHLALYELLRYAGLRLAEAVGSREATFDPALGHTVPRLVPGVRVGDLDLAGGRLAIRGKGGRTAYALVDPTTAEHLGQLLGTLRHRETAAPVFQRRDGTPKGTRWARRAFGRWVRTAGIHRPLTPHMLRHTFATRFLEAGGDIRAAQRLLRHRSITPTLIYADYTRDEALRREFLAHNRREEEPSR